MATTRPFAYNTGSTISGCDQLGDLAIGVDAIRYDLQVGNVTWFMGPDEELGYVIGLPVAAEYRPEFWRSAFSDTSFLSYVNYIDVKKGGTGTFSDADTAHTWLTAEGYWTNFTGATGTTADGFKVTIDTEVTAQSNSDQMTMPIYDGTDDVYIDWGDSSGLTTITTFPSYPVHTYDTAGEYQVTITGGLTHLRYASGSDAAKVRSLDQWGNLAWSSMYYMFYGCRNMDANYSDTPDTSAVTNMGYAFANCDDFNGTCDFDTSNVTSMRSMFHGSDIFNGDISGFDTSNVLSMDSMFLSCPVFNQPLNHFVTSGCTTFDHMFMVASSFNQSLSNWDTSACTRMDYMFYGTSFAQDLTNFDTHNVTDMHAMFFGCSTFNHDISNFNTQKVGRISSMFYGCSIFNQSVSHFVTSGVTDMHQTFQACSAFNQSLSAWDTSNVDDMSTMFWAATIFNQSVSNFNTSNVETMAGMFGDADTFNQSVSNFDTREVTDFSSMFYGAIAFDQDLSNFVTSGATTMRSMFYGASTFNNDISGWDTRNVASTGFALMFQNAIAFNQPVNHFDLRGATSLVNMFYNAESFNQPVYNWITTGITTFSQTFAYCNDFEQTLSGFTIENATNIAGICSLCDINPVGTTTNYDETLIAWESQSVASSLSVTFTSTKYGQGLVEQGTTNGTTANKLVDTTKTFVGPVSNGDIVYNTTDGTFATVTNVDSNTVLSVSVDIMVSGESYNIQSSDAAKARAGLILDDSWTIADGGPYS